MTTNLTSQVAPPSYPTGGPTIDPSLDAILGNDQDLSMEDKPTVEVIAKELTEAPRQINKVNRLLSLGDKSINPNPILGSGRERQLLKQIYHSKSNSLSFIRKISNGMIDEGSFEDSLPSVLPQMPFSMKGTTKYVSKQGLPNQILMIGPNQIFNVDHKYRVKSPDNMDLLWAPASESNEVDLRNYVQRARNSKFNLSKTIDPSEHTLGPPSNLNSNRKFQPPPHLRINKSSHNNVETSLLMNTTRIVNQNVSSLNSSAIPQDHLPMKQAEEGHNRSHFKPKGTPIIGVHMSGHKMSHGVGTGLDNSQRDIFEEDNDLYSLNSHVMKNSSPSKKKDVARGGKDISASVIQQHEQMAEGKVQAQQKTQVDFSVSNHKKSFQLQPPQKQKADNLESWTVKSSAAGGGRSEKKGMNVTGRNYLEEVGQLRERAERQILMHRKQSMDIDAYQKSHYKMNIHSQSSTTDGRDFGVQDQQYKFSVEKQEIDNFLKSVRQRKRFSLFSDPNVKYEANKYSHLISNPLKVMGIRKQSDLPARGAQYVFSGAATHQGMMEEQEDYAKKKHLTIDVGAHLPQHNQMNLRQSNSQVMIGGLQTNGATLTGVSPEKNQPSQFISPTGAANNKDYKFIFGHVKTGVGHSSSKKMIEQLQSQHRLDPPISTTAGGNSGTNLDDRLDYMESGQNHYDQKNLSFDEHKKIFQSVANLQNNSDSKFSLPKIKEVKVSPKMSLGKHYQKSFMGRNLNLMSARDLKQKQLGTSRWKTPASSGILHKDDTRAAAEIDFSNQQNNSISGRAMNLMTTNASRRHIESIQQLPAEDEDHSKSQKTIIGDQSGFDAQFQSTQAASQEDDNFFRAIEKLPNVPLLVKFMAKDKIRDFERQIREKREQIEKQRKTNAAVQKEYQENFETKKKLKKSAKQILIYQKAKEKTEELKSLLELGADEKDEAFSPDDPTGVDGASPDGMDESQNKETSITRTQKVNPASPEVDNLGESAHLSSQINQQSAFESHTMAIQQQQQSPMEEQQPQPSDRKFNSELQQPSKFINPLQELHDQKSEDQWGKEKALAEIQMRIYKFYKDYALNDLTKEKRTVQAALKQMKDQKKETKEEVKFLRTENEHIKKMIKWYKSMVTNFDDEYDNIEIHLAEKQEELDYQRKTARMENTIRKINEINKTPSSPDQQISMNPDSVSNAGFQNSNSQSNIFASRGNLHKPILGSASKEDLIKIKNQDSASREYIPPQIKHVSIAPGGGGRTVDETTLSVGSAKSNHHEKIDPRIVDKLFHSFRLVIRQDKGLDIALGLLDKVKETFGCQKATLFPLDYYAVQMMTKNLVKEKYSFIHTISFQDENENVPVQLAGIARTQDELCKKLIFKTIRQTHEDFIIKENGMKMALVVKQCKFKDSGPSFIIQLEFDRPPETEKKFGGSRKNSSLLQNSGKFNYTSAMVLQLLCMNIQLKLEKMVLVNSFREMKNEVSECIGMIGRILKTKTLKGLMRCYRSEIPKFFHFSEVTIMFHDKQANQLYTITHGDEEEQAYLLQKKKEEAKSEKEIEYIEALEAMKDVHIDANHMIQFPITTGLTSSVLNSQKTFYANKPPIAGVGFVNEVDNIKSMKDIKNFMFFALTRDEGTTNGIIQLFNKATPIQIKDRKKADAIRRFFGACIQNIEDKTTKLTQTLAVQFDTHGSEVQIGQTELVVMENEVYWDNMRKPFENMDGTLQTNLMAAEEMGIKPATPVTPEGQQEGKL